MPNSPWAGELAGHDGPRRLADQPAQGALAGHRTASASTAPAEEWSIGSRASHGCIRMRVADVIDLYPRVPVGTPVLIR